MEQSAAVGSISHILHTAFHDVYDEFQKKSDAIDAKEKIKSIQLERESAKERELKILEEAKTAAQAAKPNNKGGKKTIEPEPEPIESTILDENDSEPDILNELAVIADFTSDFDKLIINDKNRDILNSKKRIIELDLDEKHHKAKNLVSYLTDKKKDAENLELSEINNLKKQGIMVGQHIPPLSSKLHIKTSDISDFGIYSNKLLVAKELVEQNRENNLRRTGNLPISQLVVDKKNERRKYQDNLEDDKPHYLVSTANINNRVDCTKKLFIETFKEKESKNELSRKSVVLNNKDIQKPKKFYLTSSQKIENEEILKSVNHKLNYLRNPKGNPETVTRMLIKTKSKALADENKIDPDLFDESVKKYSKRNVFIKNNPLFVTDPDVIKFNNYEIGQKYSKVIKFKNISSVSRQVRVVPPRTSYFTMSPLKYPNSCSSGFVAPGIEISATICFIPSSLQELNDNLQIETEGGSYSVQIIASRELPILNLPPRFNFGACLVGDVSRVVMSVHNSGGFGKFKILAEESYDPNLNFDEIASKDSLRISPFTFYPIEFQLGRNESLGLNIEYVPLQLEDSSVNMVIISDIKQVWKFQLDASSRFASINIVEVNGIHLPSLLKDKYSLSCKDIVFDSSSIGSESYQELVVENTTGMPLEYEWIWIEPNSKNIIEATNKAIELKYINQRSFEMLDFEFKNSNLSTTRINTALGNSGNGLGSSIVDGPFVITPASGLIATNGSCAFSLSFCPQDLSVFLSKAVLLLKGVPRVAVPSDYQGELLNNLITNGHGSHVKLKSWIDSLALYVSSKRHSMHDKQKLVKLSKVIDIVNSYVKNEYDGKPFLAQFNCWVSRLVEHFVAFQSDDIDDESEITNALKASESSGTLQHNLSVILYNWTGNIDDIPIELPSKQLEFGLNCIIPEDESVFSLTGKEESDFYDEIWIDCAIVLELLGHEICNLLDLKIYHEAVEYIQDTVRQDICCLSVKISGKSSQPSIVVSPTELKIPESLYVGKIFNGSFVIKNTNNVMTDIGVDVLNINVVSFTSFESLTNPKVVFDPPRLLLMPNSEGIIQYSIVFDTVGKFKLTIPFLANNKSIKIENLDIHLVVSPPRFRFEVPEIDLGLIGVGNEAYSNFSFTNESSIEVNYSFFTCIHKTISPNKSMSDAVTKSITSNKSMQDSARSGKSYDNSDPNASEVSSFRNDIGAKLYITPNTGSIKPRETISAAIKVVTGTGPQRLRGFLECSISDISGTSTLNHQYVSLRGEIQAPKVLLFPMCIDFNKIYLGRAIEFSFTIKNITNLPTKYKIEKPDGDPTNYLLSFDKSFGTLGSKEDITINANLTATKPGVIEDLYACKISGMPYPLGLMIKAVAKGVQVDFSPLLDGMIVPKPLASVHDAQFPGPDTVPEPMPILPIVLGEDVPLYDRTSVKIVMRNLSAVPAPFDFTLKKYTAINEKASRKGAVGQVQIKDVKKLHYSAKIDSKQFLLVPQEDGDNKFASTAGKKYIGSRTQRIEDKRYLFLGLGGAHLVEPKFGTLPPWGVEVLTVNSFNDTPGCYDDDLICTINDNNIPKKVTIPIKLTIRGCPILIEKDVLGMTVLKSSNPKLDDSKLLHLGYACVGSAPLIREFYVRNNGSSASRIDWTVNNANVKINGPVKFSIALDDGEKKLKSSVKFWEDINKDIQFSIEPKNCIIKPYERIKFTVKYLKNDKSVEEKALLLCNIWGSEAHDINTKPAFTLQLYTQVNIVNPTIKVEKNTFEVDTHEKEVTNDLSLKFNIMVPNLFSKMDPNLCGSKKTITIENPLMSALIFSISTSGSFKIDPTSDSVKKFKTLKYPDTSKNLLSTNSLSEESISKGSSIGRTFQLLPNEKTSFIISFTPKRDLRDSFKTTSSLDASKQRVNEGTLIITFSSGQRLTLPLKAVLKTPFITGSSPKLFFGCCMVTKSSEATFLLSNPTRISGNWEVHHIPGGGGSNRTTSIPVSGFDKALPYFDEPSVFEITPSSGVIDGPTVSSSAAVACLPKDVNRSSNSIIPQRLVEASWNSKTLTLENNLEQRHEEFNQYPLPIHIIFKPIKNCSYSSRFRFSCQYGNTFDVLLEGKGTYEEREHAPVNPFPS